jgi:hypothetical protein
MTRVALSIMLLLAFAPAAFAQNPSASPTALGVSFVPSARQNGSGHRGLTVLVNAGAGVRRDDFYEETLTGVTSIYGIGGFVTDKVAILARYGGTTMGTLDTHSSCVTIVGSGPPQPCGIRVQSEVAGATAQFWASRRFALEGGGGLGFWNDSGGGSDKGLGLILGGTVSILKPGPHLLTAGVTYMPVFTSSMTIHAVGFVIGYQYIRIR